jgi:hypothetical protein
MNDDKLVILLKKVSVGAAPRRYYVLNPQILQSPIKDSTTYIKRDGSPFTIPLETVEGFLGWMALKLAGIIDKEQQEQLDEQVRQARHEQADETLKRLIDSKKVNYCDFLSFVQAEAEKTHLQRDSGNPEPALSDLIHEYIFDTDKKIREWESCVD